MIPLQIEITQEWNDIPNDGNTYCTYCEALCTGVIMQKYVFVNLEPTESKDKACEECYRTIQKRLSTEI